MRVLMLHERLVLRMVLLGVLLLLRVMLHGERIRRVEVMGCHGLLGEGGHRGRGGLAYVQSALGRGQGQRRPESEAESRGVEVSSLAVVDGVGAAGGRRVVTRRLVRK